MLSEALRKQVDDLIQANDIHGADAALRQLWRSRPDASTAARVVSSYGKIRAALGLTPCRVAIPRSFTVEPLVPLLRAEGFTAGLDLTVQVGEFNTWARELLDPSSALYAFEPGVVILAVHDAAIEPLRDAVVAFRRHSSAALVLHTLEAASTPARGVLDAQIPDGDWHKIHETNRAIRELASEHRGVYVLDYDALTARHGRETWHDERKWQAVRLPIAACCLRHLVREWMRFLHPLTGKVAKAIVTDLDNTLWGGVVGEDGIEGLRLAPEYPGALYQNVQRVLLDLRERGILLAICSKNNHDDAMAVLEKHPGMLLRPSDFAAVRINWNDKASNLADIAGELNIGVDALAFLDDNPVERDAVRSGLPEVTVVELPEDVLAWPQILRDQPEFERLSLSPEDTQRGQFYSGQRQRKQMEQRCRTPEDFLRSLAQEVEIAPLDAMSLARVAQLTQKTNQFNLTTRRYSEQQVAELARQPGWRVHSLRVRDRFGDNGIVGVAITVREGTAMGIDSFLLSCRVIGRGVETALLSYLCDLAKKNGCATLRGSLLPTKKNLPCREFYPSHGFEGISASDKESVWQLDLAGGKNVPAPDWIRLQIPEEVTG